jgi:ribosomal protein S18 acetylase RimI-like enzyme
VRLAYLYNYGIMLTVARYPVLQMGEAPNAAAIATRSAVSEDAEGIARTFLESAEYHARLDPERYSIPIVETISARHREARQHPPPADGKSVTLVVQLSDEIVGFIDARLEQPLDAMHREMIYCHIAEIAVSGRYQHQDIGQRLLRAAEEWGRRQGAEFASLEYHAANTRASLFYQQRMGYRVASIYGDKTSLVRRGGRCSGHTP